MSNITTIGLDLAKSVFQVHAADEDGSPVVRKKLRRAQVLGFFSRLPACLVGMEACGSAHYWARELQKLGHENYGDSLLNALIRLCHLSPWARVFAERGCDRSGLPVS